jgi:hypothetical protein
MRKILFGLVIIFLVWGYLVPLNAKTNEEIYQEKLIRVKADDIDGHYQLGLWCLDNKFYQYAQSEFYKVLEFSPGYKDAKKSLDDATHGRITEVIKRYGIYYKGILDTGMTDANKLSWNEACIKETEHFIIKCNIANPLVTYVLEDTACLVECNYVFLHGFLGFTESQPKDKLVVFQTTSQQVTEDSGAILKNQSAMPHVPPELYKGGYTVALCLDNHVLELSHILLHETTHYAIGLVCRSYNISSPPVWLNEGLAAYFEANVIESNKFRTNCINTKYLPAIKELIKSHDYIALKSFINIGQSKYSYSPELAKCYPQGWSLLYFLMNGLNGKYRTGFIKYVQAWQSGKIAMWNGVDGKDVLPKEPDKHIKIFEDCIGVSLEELEKEWQAYILYL